MPYDHILELIDADLERLKKARLILTRAGSPARSILQKADSSSVRSTTSEIPANSISFTSLPQDDKYEIQAKKQVKHSVPKKQASPDRHKAHLPKVVQNVFPASIESLTLPIHEVLTPRAASDSEAKSELILVLNEIHQKKSLRQVRAPKKDLSGSVAEPTVVRVRKIRNKTTSRQPIVVSAPSPLGGFVPNKPVYIPARQVQLDRSQNNEDAATTLLKSGRQTAIPLTAELLTQRWIQGLDS